MTRGMRTTPRSAVLVAVMAFGAVAMLGTMVGFLVYGISAGPSHVRNGVGIAGLVAAAIGYVVQQQRIKRDNAR